MTLRIEPMITAGLPEVYVHDDDWSISSVDESLAAHFEHTVAITAEGPRVLTRRLEASAAKRPRPGQEAGEETIGGKPADARPRAGVGSRFATMIDRVRLCRARKKKVTGPGPRLSS